MIQCNIFNELGYNFVQDSVRRRVVNVIEDKAKEDGDFWVDVYVVDVQEMKRLHKIHMETSEATDVLSFPLDYDRTHPDKIIRLGDVVICFEVAKNQAGNAKLSVQEEIENLAEHGTLHLLGYHHD